MVELCQGDFGCSERVDVGIYKDRVSVLSPFSKWSYTPHSGDLRYVVEKVVSRQLKGDGYAGAERM